MKMETPIARVRGLGSARSGAHHWWLERLTSISTLVLFVWLLMSLLRLPSLDHQAVTTWLASPVAAVPMLLLIVSTFWHLKLGLQVVIEDYVHEDGWKLFSITLLNFLTIAGGALAFFSVLKIAFGGDVTNG
ncbi:succinate dehydrogenase, hydrophobic membrane anchor protein [Sphingosinicella sp. GR2756]|uniref:Succinate dehydrogenase hydrophobic membrane anchor subunit n=2 Tax=Sphingosinicella rhizophila TaxID=3050082 RepID=A0ABU3Q3F1_9SPHN|nr:succinate dehydrogenase, hydrophobic membrane anchor protein [Sphingosinicella sp. GR2756]MDT9597930.1 succinate dehydrogenase, hydrophobic membrane anchor protein [Sphingosinicella sp. GR2756]